MKNQHVTITHRFRCAAARTHAAARLMRGPVFRCDTWRIDCQIIAENVQQGPLFKWRISKLTREEKGRVLEEKETKITYISNSLVNILRDRPKSTSHSRERRGSKEVRRFVTGEEGPGEGEVKLNDVTLSVLIKSLMYLIGGEVKVFLAR